MGKPEGKIPLGRPTSVLEDNIKVDLNGAASAGII